MPSETLNLMETLSSRDASVSRLFGGTSRIRQHTPRQVAEAVRLYREVREGSRPSYHLREAMSTSDYPLLFGDALDRQLLARYNETPAVWQNYCRRARVPDFREVKRFAVDGAEGTLAEVAEGDPYTTATTDETEYSYQVAKYGRMLELTWEKIVNDDLDAFGDYPDRLARAARRSEDRFATELHVDADGPHATFYTAGNGNLIDDPLSIAGLQAGIEAFLSRVDEDDEPIDLMGIILEVGPGNWVTAQNILNQLTVDVTERGGTDGQRVRVNNWVAQNVRLVHNPYIPIVADGGVDPAPPEPWFLHADPGESRPAFEMGFLRGHEAPDLRVKSSDSRAVGGGEVDPFEGDFADDSIKYRVRHVFGGTQLDPRASLASSADAT